MTSASDLVVGLDCSTHGAKAIAWDLNGQPVAEARASWPLLTPRPGWYEQRAQDWSEATLDALTQIASQVGPRVRAIGITHQRETFVGVDAHGTPVRNAIVWMDERAHAEVAQLRSAMGDEPYHRITGKPLSLTPSISKILWLRNHEPEAAARVHRWLEVQGFVSRALTGEDLTSVGSADPTGLLDIRSADWSDELLGACGLTRDCLPALAPSGTRAGTLTPAVAQRTGLDGATAVVLGAGDGQVAALGAQVCSLDRAYLNLGTAIVSGVVSDSLLIDRAFRTMSGALPGTFLFESDLKGGAFTIDWLCKTLLAEATAPAQLEREAAGVAPGSEALVLVPYFATVMNPYWDDDASGILVGLRGSHGPAHLFRAILEGIALEQRLHLREIERATAQPISRVHVTGGGAASDLWCRILADAIGRTVVRTRTSEATSLGASMLAAAAIGLFPSARHAAESMGATTDCFEPGEDAPTYARLFDEVYAGLYPSLREALSRLAAFARSRSP